MSENTKNFLWAAFGLFMLINNIWTPGNEGWATLWAVLTPILTASWIVGIAKGR